MRGCAFDTALYQLGICSEELERANKKETKSGLSDLERPASRLLRDCPQTAFTRR
jgi:hypothetical protein